jgi:hypothetical protein
MAALVVPPVGLVYSISILKVGVLKPRKVKAKVEAEKI